MANDFCGPVRFFQKLHLLSIQDDVCTGYSDETGVIGSLGNLLNNKKLTNYIFQVAKACGAHNRGGDTYYTFVTMLGIQM